MSQEPSSRRRPARGRGTVAILALLFLTSAGLRITTSATEVIAEAKSALDLGSAAHAVEETSSEPHLSDAHFARLLKDFERREADIVQKELDIEKRMIVLEATEARVEEQLAQMDAAEQRLRSTLALASTAAEDDLARLTAVYENMKPKTAAALFEEMAPDFAAGFISRMRPDAAASVLAGMTPQAAYSISTILAGRNAEVPKE